MPVDALRESVPYSRAERNTKSAISITPAQLRCQARMAVVCDTRLSPGARLLYVLLDDRAGQKARCWPSQDSLARDLGVSRRSVQGWLYELVDMGHLRAKRGQAGNSYVMAWHMVDPESTPVDTQPTAQPFCASDAQPAAHGYMEDFEPENEPVPACTHCRDTGHLGDPHTGPLCDCPTGRAIRARLFRR